MKKLFTLAAFVVVGSSVALAQDQTADRLAEPSTKAVPLAPVSTQSTADATKRSTVEGRSTSIVLTNEQVDSAIAEIEQQMAQREGTEGYVREDYLRRIEKLNKRRPQN
jgi:hypothetical protein